MASYDMLVFSQEVFKDEIFKIYDEALNEAVKVIQSNEWFRGTIPVQKDVEGYDSYTEVVANDLKAWIVEYGQGEEAEYERNPYWEEYVNSGYTSEYRNNGTVLKRGAKPYKSIDFEHNRIIEHDHGSMPEGTRVSNALQRRLAIEPHPFLQKLLASAYESFNRSVEEQMATFDISKCFITTPEHV